MNETLIENFPPNRVEAREKSGPIGPVALSPMEAHDLSANEAGIGRVLESFWQLGLYLSSIRDRRLYRQHYATFEDYCEQRWELSGRYARRVCAAAQVTQLLSVNADLAKLANSVLPASESQARPLTALPPHQVIEVWSEVTATAPGGKVTARFVRDVVDRKLGTVEKHRTSNLEHPASNGKTLDTGTRTERIQALASAAIDSVRDLLDATGTADSVATTDVTDALRKLDNFRDHLSRVKKLQESRI